MAGTKNKLSDVRNALFLVLEDLQENRIEVKKATAITNVCRAIVDSAKLELKAAEVFGREDSAFFDAPTLPAGKPNGRLVS